ncbi:unnamed protein product [Cochlearia groenlandica]
MYDCFKVEVGEVAGRQFLNDDNFHSLVVFGVVAFDFVKLAVDLLVSDPLVARERTASSSSESLATEKFRGFPDGRRLSDFLEYALLGLRFRRKRGL